MHLTGCTSGCGGAPPSAPLPSSRPLPRAPMPRPACPLGPAAPLPLPLGPFPAPCPCRGSRLPSPTPWPARSPTSPRPAPCTWAPCPCPCAPFPCPGPFPAPCPESRRPPPAPCSPPLLRPSWTTRRASRCLCSCGSVTPGGERSRAGGRTCRSRPGGKGLGGNGLGGLVWVWVGLAWAQYFALSLPTAAAAAAAGEASVARAGFFPRLRGVLGVGAWPAEAVARPAGTAFATPHAPSSFSSAAAAAAGEAPVARAGSVPRFRGVLGGARKGSGHGKGAQGHGQGAQVQGAGRGAVGEQAGQGGGDGGRDPRHGQGAGKGPKGKGKGAAGPKGQARRGMGAQGGGRDEGRGPGSGVPRQPDVQPVWCIPPGIQQMPAHHTHHHHHHHHHHLYNIDPDAGELVPPQPPRPRHQPAPPAPRAEPARMASAEGERGAASAPQAQGQQGEPARGGEGGRPWDRDWGAVPDPLGEKALPLVGEVYGWLCWANQGTTRGLRNRPFDAVLLRRDGGNREGPPGGWAAPEDHERVLRSVIGAAWPDREPTWPAFLEGGAVLRITDADANNWLPRALRSALAHWRYRRRNPPPPQPQPSHKRRRR